MQAKMISNISALRAAVFIVFGLLVWGAPVWSQDNFFAPGWDLDPASSFIHFRSIKNVNGQNVIETHSFATFTSTIEADGAANINVLLESVDTNNDLRNVRMRFIFFETFKFPQSTVTLQLTPDMADGLEASGQKSLALPFSFNIHGVTNQMTAIVSVALESSDRIVVTSVEPVMFRVAEFGLAESLQKIAVTAGGFQIEPEMAITFQLAYTRRAGGAAPAPEVTASAEPEAPEPSAALETQGDFSLEECIGRFEILSETGNIYFASGSARLESESDYVLKTIIDVINRCPGLRLMIAGHTDSDGSAGYNLSLSEKRAKSVVDYLTQRGIERDRLTTAGFGEDRPMVPNDTDFNKGRNRRIEFSLNR